MHGSYSTESPIALPAIRFATERTHMEWQDTLHCRLSDLQSRHISLPAIRFEIKTHCIAGYPICNQDTFHCRLSDLKLRHIALPAIRFAIKIYHIVRYRMCDQETFVFQQRQRRTIGCKIGQRATKIENF